MENPRRLLSALLLGDALVNLPLIIIGLFVLHRLVPKPMPWWASALILFSVIIFLCDLIPEAPRALADLPARESRRGSDERTDAGLSTPSSRVLQRVSKWLADALTPKSLEPVPFLSEDELETLVQLSAEEGALHETESEMIQEIIKLGDKTAKDCMTPRVDTFAVPDDLSNDELLPRLSERRLRRVPVYGETPDEIEGILDVQAFLLSRARTIRSCSRRHPT
jgi:CBS domain containing-hemolysin-like protein